MVTSLGRRQIVFFLLLLSALPAVGDDLVPPDLYIISHLSCSIVCNKGDGTKCTEWQTMAVAAYINPTKHHDGKPWTMLLSIRKTLKSSADDCSRWLEAVKKAQKDERKKVPAVIPNKKGST